MIRPSKDVTVDEAQPDTNLDGESTLTVRSEAGANRRTYLEFDFQDLLPDWIPHGIIEEVTKATLIAKPTSTDPNRTIGVWTSDGGFDEDTITWNNQPGPVVGFESPEDLHTPSEETPHAWDVTEPASLAEGETPVDWPLIIADETEDASTPHEQAYASTSDSDGFTFRLQLDVTVRQRFQATADAHVDENDPDATFHDATDLWVVSDSNENRRIYAQFPLTGIPDEPNELTEAALTTEPISTSDDQRTLEARQPDQDIDTTTLTWNNQPTLGDPLATHANSDATPHTWESTSLKDLVENEWHTGQEKVQLALLDQAEDAGVLERHEQQYASLENPDPPGDARPLRLEVVIADFLQRRNLPSKVQPRIPKDETLGSHVTPRLEARDALASQVRPGAIPRVKDLASAVTNRAFETVFSSITPGYQFVGPLHSARVRGSTRIRVPFPVDELEAIINEAGSQIVIDEIPQAAIVQLQDEASLQRPRHVAGETGTTRRGDATLFALEQEVTFTPGLVLTWQGREWIVTGLLSAEHVTDDVVFREVGLSRLAVSHEARVVANRGLRVDLESTTKIMPRGEELTSQVTPASIPRDEDLASGVEVSGD